MSRPVITMRHHVVSLVAVFLALAVGIALGGGPLGGAARTDPEPVDETSPTLSTAGGETSSAAEAYADSFAAAGAARLYADGLAGHAVAMLAMPGADEAQLAAVLDQVLAAGGASTGTYTLSPAALDPAASEDLDAVIDPLISTLADPRVDPAAPTYERLGRLLALAMATTAESSVRADPSAAAIRDSLAAADLLTGPSDVRLAPLVLVVLPPGGPPGQSSLGTGETLAGLVEAMSVQTTGVAVAGDTESADSGELAALRASELVGPVSTVDALESAIGRVTTTLALIGLVEGAVGSFGESGADGAVPLP